MAKPATCTIPAVQGFTLWELILTLAVAGTVVSLGLPALNWLVLDTRLTADVNGFVAAVQVARTEAAKRGSTIVMCNSRDGSSCDAGTSDFGEGWIVFDNRGAERPPVRDASDPVLHAYRPNLSGSIASNRSYFEFRPFLKRSTNGTVTFCDARGSSSARAVIVSYTGRPRTTAARDGANLSCPAT